MDPFSVPGIVIAATSMAFQIFAACVKGYQLLIDMDTMPEHYEHLRIRLRIEQARFLDWGDKIGLVEELLEQPSTGLQLKGGSVVAVLLEIQRLFKECIRIEAKFETSLDSSKDEGDGDSKATTPQDHHLPERRKLLLKKTLRLLNKTLQVQTRLSWAMIKHEAFEKLIQGLISFNDSIVSLLDRSAIDELRELQLQNQLISLQLCTKVDELKQLSRAMQYSPGHASQNDTWETRSVVPGPTVTDHNAEDAILARLASFKARQASLESNPALANVRPTSLNEINLLDDTALRSQAICRDKHVWIEWKYVEDDARTKERLAVIEQRIRKLTVLLAASAKPALFRGPNCVGFCRDLDRRNPRYGLIFERPVDHPPADRLVSLLTLLKEKHKTSLTTRIRLAHSIARSLMYLHSVNWLHKGLRSDNIIFFVSEDGEPDMDNQIVAGFEYARPDLPDEETDKPRGRFEHNIYRHPEVLGAHNPRSQKSHDIYSLGVILIEIALWQPVQDAVTEAGTQASSRMRISKFRQALLDPHLLINVEMHAGEKYRRVVERCLLGGLAIGVPPGTDESSPAVGAAMLTAFVEEVVVPLKGIHI